MRFFTGRIRCCGSALALLALTASAPAAQDFRGSITGRVSDTSGGWLPGVTVTVTNVATNIGSTTITNNDGAYTIAYLTPGNYTVKVELSGFKKVVREGIEVRVGDRLALDFNMEVGQIEETVLVTAQSPLLEMASGSAGQVIDEKRIALMLLSDGNPFVLARLVPGVAYTGDLKFSRPFDNAGTSAINADGSGGGNEFTLGACPRNVNTLLVGRPPAKNGRHSQVVPRGARLLGAREALLRRAPRWIAQHGEQGERRAARRVRASRGRGAGVQGQHGELRRRGRPHGGRGDQRHAEERHERLEGRELLLQALRQAVGDRFLRQEDGRDQAGPRLRPVRQPRRRTDPDAASVRRPRPDVLLRRDRVALRRVPRARAAHRPDRGDAQRRLFRAPGAGPRHLRSRNRAAGERPRRADAVCEQQHPGQPHQSDRGRRAEVLSGAESGR